MIEYILITLIIIFAIVNIYYPFINTNSKKIVLDVNNELIMKNELNEVDKKISDLTSNKNLNSIQSNKVENYENQSVHKLTGRIDENDCYNAQFKVCNKKYGLDGYEIFTPVQQGCMYPDDKISPYEAAYSQVDKYLALLPPATGTNSQLTDIERKTKCLNKPSVKIGLNNFGICNKDVLKKRCKNLNSQKQGIADLNSYVSLDDLNTGVENMKLIYASCFPDDEPLVC